jgi:ribosomal-protein-alanine N-acetyltransferase
MDTLDRPFLVGEKIYLSPLDMDHVNANYLNWINDEEVIKFLDIKFPTTLDQLENYVKAILNSQNNIFFAIMEKETNNHIGNAKIGPIDWIHRTANYGRMLGDKSSWGKGYGTESLELLLKYVFKKINLHKIWTLVVESHITSIKSNQKAGFKIEGKLKEHLFKDGKYVDAVVVSITSDEYFSKVNEI